MKFPGEPSNFLLVLALSILQVYFLTNHPYFLSNLVLAALTAATSMVLLYAAGEMFYENIVGMEKRFLHNPQGAVVILLSIASVVDEIFLIGVATIEGLGSVGLGAIIGSNVFVAGVYVAYLVIKRKKHYAPRMDFAVIITGTGLLILSGILFGRIIMIISVILLLAFAVFLLEFRNRVTVIAEVGVARRPQALLIILGLAGISLGAYNVVHATEAISGFLGISSFFASFIILGAAASIPEDYLVWLALTKKREAVADGIVFQSTIYKEMLLLPIASLLLVIYVGTDALVTLAVLFALTLMLAVMGKRNGD